MTVPAVTAPFLAASAVLAAAGAAKLGRPDYTARALQAAGLRLGRRRAGRGAVRAGAAVEAAVGVLGVVRPGPLTGALVAASYSAFALFVLLALYRGWPLSSCGCFGRPDSRPGYQHAVLNAGAAAVSAWWALDAPGRLGRLFVHEPWNGAPLLLLSAVIAGLAYLIWTSPLTKEVA